MLRYLSTLLELENVSLSSDLLHKTWLKTCYQLAQKSKHPTTKIAALLVKDQQIILDGKNELPEGVKAIAERFADINRHLYSNHAKRDLVYKAAKNGIATNNLCIVTSWHPCLQCANAIISSGISQLVIHKQMVERTNENWQLEMLEAAQILVEAGIEVLMYDGLVNKKSLMNKEWWKA